MDTSQAATQASTAAPAAPVLPTEGRGALRPLGSAAVRLTGGFWAAAAARNRERTIPAGYEQLEAAGTLHNFRLAAGAAREGYRALGIMFDKPFPFLDSDVYKWLEGAGWELGRAPDAKIQAMADEAIGLVEAAQRPDGYLNTFVQVLAPGTEYADLQWGHELYCIGHLVQASVAWHRAVGDDRLLLVARRAVDSVERALGPDGRQEVDGHPEIEMALVELYRMTGERRYLELARLFIDRRGHGILGPGRFGRRYWQDHLPVREAPSAVGHAVRQLYLDCGAVDAAVELDDRALLEAVHRRWRDMVETKMYLTGALGSRHKDEAFGDAYELPPDRAYAETCAAIASVMLAWRLLLATGDAACADVIERTMYNAVLPSLSLDGAAFFYVNPLQRRTRRTWHEAEEGQRAAWYACACCPPNLMRIISSWPQLLATTTEDGVQIHQYAASEIEASDLRLSITTDMPWSGDIAVTIVSAPDAPRELTLRVPAWADRAQLTSGGAAMGARGPDGRSIGERRVWRAGESLALRLDAAPRVVRPHPMVDAVRGCVAIERGPLVYAIETADLPPGVELEALAVSPEVRLDPRLRPELGQSVIGLDLNAEADGRPVAVGAIPYHLWANRGDGGMRVWIPEAGA